MIAQHGRKISTRRRIVDRLFGLTCAAAAGLATLVLVILVGKVLYDGLPFITGAFLTSAPSLLFPKKAGISYVLLGSMWIMILTVVITVPLGVGAAIYLEEFNTKRNRLTDFIQLNISNLAGVPSIVFGMLGLGIFIGIFGLGKNVLAGALTMSILALPVVIMVTQEALKAVPRSYREASLALGATRWDAVRTVVLPSARAGILTGMILAAARAVGETAPLIVVGAASMTNFPPRSWDSRYSVIPLQVLDWIQSPRSEFHSLAAAAIIVLMVMLFTLNFAAIVIRSRSQTKSQG